MLGLRQLQGKGGAAATAAVSACTVASTHGADTETSLEVAVGVAGIPSLPPLVHVDPAVIEEAFQGLRRCDFRW